MNRADVKIPASVVEAIMARPAKLWPRFHPACVLIVRVAAFDQLLADAHLQELCELASQGIRDVSHAADSEGGYLDLSCGRVTQVVFGEPRPPQAPAALRTATALAEIVHSCRLPGDRSSKTTAAYALGLSSGECVTSHLGGENQVMLITLGTACARARRLAEIAAPGEILLDEAFRRELEASGSRLPAVEALEALDPGIDQQYYRIVPSP